MAGFTLSEIREAIADQIRANIEREATVNAYDDGLDPDPPRITVRAARGSYYDHHETFENQSTGRGGLAKARFRIVVEPGGNDPESARRRLDDFLSIGTGNTSSIIDALYSDTSLGLTNCHVAVVDIEADDENATAEIAIEVHINKVGAS